MPLFVIASVNITKSDVHCSSCSGTGARDTLNLLLATWEIKFGRLTFCFALFRKNMKSISYIYE